MKRVAFVFPGQGSQYIGMGKDIYDNYSNAREVFDRVSNALSLDLAEVCFYDCDGRLGLTTFTQPAILTTSLAIWACLENPDGAYLTGHSLGEFSAFVAGGALGLEDGARLVSERGRYMQEAVPVETGGMAAIIGLEKGDIDEICKETWQVGKVWAANYNCPGQIVITGEKRGLLKAIEMAHNRVAKRALILPMSIPSHCPLMAGAAQRLAEKIDEIEIKDLEIPVVSNCWAKPILKGDDVKQNMVQQLISGVLWEDCVRLMIGNGVTRFIEVGPGKVLSGLIKRIDRDVETFNVSDIKGVERIKEIM